MKTLAIVTARGGSKGFPGKNAAELAGRSLVGWAYRTLDVLRARHPDITVLLSTDSAELAALWPPDARPACLRPAELAADDSTSMDVLRYELRTAAEQGTQYDAVLLLQPTSPLITADDLERGYAMLKAGAEVCIGVAPVAHPPAWAVHVDADNCVSPATELSNAGKRRQAVLPAYCPVGFYCARSEFVVSHDTFVEPGVTRAVIVSRAHAVDIDERDDLLVAASRLADRGTAATIHVDGKMIGGESSCFVIAEAGVNHNGDLALAHQLIDVAADAGADAVKFQTFVPESVVAATAPKAEYQQATTGTEGSQLDMLRALALPKHAWRELYQHASDRDIMFLSTPFDDESADLLAEMGVDAFKVPSGELTNHPFVARLAARGKPMLVSTGMATLDEVDAALRVIADTGNNAVALFHCVTNYPAAAEDCNLAAMRTMRDAFGVPVGWSDHTEGLLLSLAAVAMGASLLEKHFTLDRALPGPDHAASLNPAELREMMASIRAVTAARGDGRKAPRPAELPLAALIRRSLHAARDLPAGHTLSLDDVVALRPATGIAPSDLSQVLGRQLDTSVTRGAVLTAEHLVS